MNSKVLMVVALLFAGSVSATPDGVENITLVDYVAPVVTPVVTPVVIPVVTLTRYARLKKVVVNNPYKTGAAVVVTVAVIAAVIAYANSANEVATEESDENTFSF